jgi:phage terminase large subunit
MNPSQNSTDEERLVCSESFFSLLDDEHYYLLMGGGKGSGKSEFAARKVIYRCRKEGNHNFLVLRKVAATCKESVVLVMTSALNEMGIPFRHSLTANEIRFLSFDGKPNRILFAGLDVWQKIKSRKGVSGVVLEELTEFTEKEFDEIDLMFREDTGHYPQIMAMFNPDESLAPWIKRRFYDEVSDDIKDKLKVHSSTVMDNPIDAVRNRYLPKLQGIKDPTYRKIYLEGLWAAPKGIIFNWDVVAMPNWTGRHVEVFYCGDFGFSIDVATFIKIYKSAGEYWVEEIIYELGLTNIAMANRIKQVEPDARSKPSYWDSSEPKSIEELYQCGINAKPARKGPDSVRSGIDYLLEQTIHIVQPSPHIVSERKKYKWLEDKHGEPVKPAEPVDIDNHTMDAIRYGIVTHCKHSQQSGFVVSQKSVY